MEDPGSSEGGFMQSLRSEPFRRRVSLDAPIFITHCIWLLYSSIACLTLCITQVFDNNAHIEVRVTEEAEGDCM